MATENLTGKNVRLGNKSALNRASFYSEENKLSCRKNKSPSVGSSKWTEKLIIRIPSSSIKIFGYMLQTSLAKFGDKPH